MTTKEKLMMQVNSEFIRNLIKQRNAGTEDCITSSELAREIGIPVAKTGELLEIVYPVWTDKGQRMIKEKMNERNSKN